MEQWQQANNAFSKKLKAETALLAEWFTKHYFTEEALQIGAELEFFLLDAHLNPLFDNLQFIEAVDKEFLISEVGAAHLEINTPHYALTGNCFSLLHQSILKSLHYCKQQAKKNQYSLAMIGSLPTANTMHHHPSCITQKNRYHVLNNNMRKHNDGLIHIHVSGFETLDLQAESLAVNGLLSAFQIHLQIGLSQSVRYYNVAQFIAGPVLALSTNSPFFLNHALWHESRVFIFNEAMTLNKFKKQQDFHCCLFGNDYLQSSFLELFQKNIDFPYLMPEIQAFAPEKMFHVRRQNGVIYRWNRPVIDFNAAGQPHLRIEHRGLSSGPTAVDMVANAAFYYGLMQYYYDSDESIQSLLPFAMARQNFFEAARHGLNANLHWGSDHRKIPVSEIVMQLIPLAKKGLTSLSIDEADITFYLGIIQQRVEKNTSGSLWQLEYVKKYGKDFHALLAAYLEYQYKDITISAWEI